VGLYDYKGFYEGTWAMKRFFVEAIDKEKSFHIIKGSEARHISRVMRMGRGDRFILMDDKGVRFLTIIESVGSGSVRVVLEKRLPEPPPPPVSITTCQSVLKSRRMDYLIQKTSELGVDLILPFNSGRAVVRLDKKMLAGKLRHWREIARSSAKQCDRGRPAEIGPFSSFKELIEKWRTGDAVKVILWEEEEKRDLKGLLRASSPQDKFIGVVGPEGGFTREEIELAMAAGFIPVSLGRRILRAETAALAITAIVQYEWGDLGLAG